MRQRRKTGGGGEIRKDDKARAENWARVVDLVQTAFREGDRAEDLKGWLATARRREKEREAATKDGGREKGEIRKEEKAGAEN